VAFRKAIQLSLKFPQWGDALSIKMSAGAVYRAMLDRPDIQAIKDPIERQNSAENLAVTELERVLQSPHQSDRPTFIRRGGSTLKVLTTFTSALTPKVAQTLQAIREAQAAGCDMNSAAVKSLRKKIFVHHFLGGFAQWLVSIGAQSLFYDDDEFDEGELWELGISTLLGPWAGIPIMGIVMESAMNGVANTPSRSGLLSGLTRDAQKVGKLFRGIGEVVADDKEFTEWTGETIKFLSDQLPATRRSRQFYEKWYDNL
jgi:hypothetical protein